MIHGGFTTPQKNIYQKYWTKQSSFFKISVQLAIASIFCYHCFIDISSDLFNDTVDFIKKYGYPVETHVVEGQNGYLLTIHRIPHGRNDESRGKRPVVFIQHGIMCSSDIWVYSGPETDLLNRTMDHGTVDHNNDGLIHKHNLYAFMLADNGYDVWLGNSRGNHYADRHVNKSITKEQYWDFSWHDMGYYDLPAVIDYILNETKEDGISYIGHSMGTTMFFVMGSTRPEYNQKIKLMIGLAPVATLQKFSTLTQKVLVPTYIVFGDFMKLLNRYQLFPRMSIRTYLINLVCKDRMPTEFLCKQLAFGVAGDSHEQYNSSAISVILTHVPAGSSKNQVLHFYQNMNKEKFQQRDFGPEENLRKYNSTEPPEYDLSKVTAPISIYYGENDMLAPPKGVHQLAKSLPNVVGLHSVPHPDFNHFDFAWGIDVNRLLYDDILKELNERVAASRKKS